ncbi:D-alanyl-D-alanine carboxypeptidase/D-alanyl-D-alanine endopeptidase [Thioalkalivibrio sp. HK1]|uniref:D-alanyl-D-alanine carboxypeptidase/D-alanyl-D-alanine endopeptidase n=1 Tax=Thioalkalivibrio sp. HK1 TaxID=1469245 RepID=UPI0018CBF33C|nr:D-alanyl-D-alanine carboxypeptidase/D-alanyl-D-alanine-endopeptidase [Thioalkalivibrio sp. HK1]
MRVLRLCKIISAFALTLGSLLSQALAADPEPPLPEPIRDAFAQENVDPDGISLWIQEMGKEKPLVAYRPDAARVPASVIKVLTTFAALDILGPDFRWKTRVLRQGEVGGGRLDGDLYIEGGGDPHLLGESLWRILQSLRGRGIRHIEGDVVFDEDFFSLAQEDPGSFDERPYRSYNALPRSLLFNFSSTHFSFHPDSSAGKVVITTDPPLASDAVHNRLRLTAGACGGRHYRIRMRIEGEGLDRRVRFSGDYPASCGSHSFWRSTFDSQTLLQGAFRSLWSGLDASLAGGFRTGSVPDSATEVIVEASPPLVDLLRPINKFSNNVMSRQLLLTIGAHGGETPGTVDKGREVIREWLEARGIESAGLFLDNGSGLSRRTRITARTLGEILRAAHESPLMAEFVSSLPLLGVDGTLRRRLKNTRLAGRVHAKTGLIDDVRSLAGYLHGSDGRDFVVVVLHNQPGAHYGQGTRLQDALLRWLWSRSRPRS